MTSSATEPIRHFYADWTQYRSRLVEAVRDLTDEQLAISAGPEHAPIWALAAHCAGARTYWLCGVLGEPGAETTPFPDPFAELGWEDDLDHPRSAAELVLALETTDAIIERCLDAWTVDMLEVEFERAVRRHPPAPHAPVDPAPAAEPRRVPQRRDLAAAGRQRPAGDRPLGPPGT